MAATPWYLLLREMREMRERTRKARATSAPNGRGLVAVERVEN
jgi:hypothetical protein